MEKGDVLTWVLGLLAVTILIYLPAGEYVRRRTARDGRRAEQALHRAIQRTSLAFFAVCLVFFLFVAESRQRLGPVVTAVILYALPLYWMVASVIGSSRLEIRTRGLRSAVLRFSRFNLFVAFLMGGQGLPFLSAAFAAPADLDMGRSLIPWFVLHIFLAIAIGFGLRRLVTRRLVRPQPIPDEEITERLQAVARENRIRFREVLLVPHERGQSVNALAATSSRKIYIAEGLREGLHGEELQAVLLHELGHFAQRFTNVIRNLSVPALALVIWLMRARWYLESEQVFVLTICMLGFVLSGVLLFRWICHRSEARADRFAEDHGEPGALARALRKIYARNLMQKRLYDAGTSTHPGLRHRLAALSDG